jgi:hypothetical protein
MIDNGIVRCTLVDASPPLIEGVTKEPCALCEELVWVSPSTSLDLPDLPRLCHPCADRVIEAYLEKNPNETVEIGMTFNQVLELIKNDTPPRS